MFRSQCLRNISMCGGTEMKRISSEFWCILERTARMLQYVYSAPAAEIDFFLKKMFPRNRLKEIAPTLFSGFYFLFPELFCYFMAVWNSRGDLTESFKGTVQA